ncbi:MAG: ABC transporter substrate-binding protein [Gammaproteobacteria bacterium]|nr:ABC transporter substrate-binding protein [Gammaproteobacteria bacterium]MBI5615362.1 ABC transporter substrate-binding protein [Gammaproteobacteria bacterium]
MARMLALTLGLLMGLWTASAPAAPTDDAKAVVEKLHDTLLNAMKDAQKLGFKGRYALIEPALRTAFDFETISRIITGPHWKTLNDAQHLKFIDVFTKLSIATYANNFDGFSGEHFETASSEEKRGNMLVKTFLVKSDGKKVDLNYVLQKHGDAWQIVNVVAEGVSDLSLKRADYTAVIGSEGFDSLIAKLNEKIASYESGSK